MSPRSIPSDRVGNKRRACDRCRSQKLRCQRGSGSRCRRCEKAHVNCITAPALRSGRPIQHSNVCQEPAITVSDDVPGYAGISPPPAVGVSATMAFETAPESSFGPPELHHLARLPSIGAMDDAWIYNFDQTSTINSMNSASGIFQPAEIRHNTLNRLAELQAKVLADLETVKACKTIDQCPESMDTTSSISSQNVLIGQMLDHSTVLLDLLNHLLPDQGAASSIPPCDTPTLCTLMSCFVSLTRIYRIILSCLLDSIPLLSTIQPPIPQIFPGMHLGGFKLENRVDLQIQILVQISEDMIKKIETKFGLYDDRDTTLAGDTSTSGKMARMLRPMLDEESSEQPPLYEPRGTCKPLKEIISLLKIVKWEPHHP